MIRLSILTLTAMMSGIALGQVPAPASVNTNAPAAPSAIPLQEMLVSGPTQLKLHSLAMISQGNIEGDVDESYLPGLKVCAEDPALPLRSVSAQLLGQHFVQGKEKPNPQALELLNKLAKDESSYVRFNAVYYGLSQIQHKTDEQISRLIDIACQDRTQGLVDRIAEALKPDRERVIGMLDRKLKEERDIAPFEIYKDLTGKAPAQTEKYLNMASSLPRLFIFKGDETDPDSYKAELVSALKKAGVENPIVQISGVGENYVLMLKTYITKDRLAVEKNFADHSKFPITQSMWLTPEMEIQLKGKEQES